MLEGILVCILILCGTVLESSTVYSKKSKPGSGSKPPGSSPDSGSASGSTFDVTKFGAVGNGKTDDAKAFQSAWASACKSTADKPTVIVPSGRTFLVSHGDFQGPCKSRSIIFKIDGTIVANTKQAWGNADSNEWLYFFDVDGLSVLGDGNGVIDGQGQSWWKTKQVLGKNNDGNNSPTAMRFSHCKNLRISGLKHLNSQKNHISINGCDNVDISNLRITAPEKSPNTDGIDISSSTNVKIQDSVMGTGDDCIAINGGTSRVMISGVTCGPGHGISVGSLGKDGKVDQVEGIRVENCTFIRTQNGVRIKTWQGGKGFAKNITFSNINFVSANNPVIIDQYYCPHMKCSEKGSAVQVSDVKFLGLHGTSVSKNATISLRCSETVPCTGIVLDDVKIQAADAHGATASCINARGISQHCSPPLSCLKP